MSKPIEDYALIGDRRSGALVARDGSIDWLCWPRFDSDACFAALVGDERHGRWHLAPRAPSRSTRRRYRPDTLILETRHETAAGTVTVVDLMPIGAPHGAVIRHIVGEVGAVDMMSTLDLRFDYGNMPPWLRAGARTATAVVGPDRVILRADVSIDCRGGHVTAAFRVARGETVTFVLQYGLSHEAEPTPIDAAVAIEVTGRYWTDWIGAARLPTPWRDAVKRSLITLQSLTHATTGGIVAAPTLGLPEIPGGSANWDYRYCWLRDSTFTLDAFLGAGFREEAVAWRDWLLRTVAGDAARMQTVYRCDGARRVEGHEIPWLPGYDGARPVRVGNAAETQVQLDIYGEVLDTLFVAEQAGIDEERPWDVRVEDAIVAHIAAIWDRPDQGIWESRGPPRHFIHSKVMAWVGIDRFLRLAASRKSVDRPRRRRLAALRDEIHARICRDGFDARRGSFVRAFGADDIDASLLRLPLVDFLPVSDQRIAGTIAAVERELVEDGLVRRHARRREPDEGAFIACTCWLADCLALQGRHDEARVYFERVLSLANDVGLLAEEWDTERHRLMGNFPQALSHLALVSTALRLTKTDAAAAR